MIARLSGVVIEKGNDFCIIDVNGVGYKVFCAASILNNVKIDEKLIVRTEHIVREDAIYLYGFINEAEQVCFNLLTGVQGIGGKVAMSIFSIISVEGVIIALSEGDIDTLCSVSGVGDRLAKRMVNELKASKILKKLRDSVVGVAEDLGGVDTLKNERHIEDAVSAMMGLGFHKKVARNAVSCAVQKLGSDCNLDELIKEALNSMHSS